MSIDYLYGNIVNLHIAFALLALSFMLHVLSTRKP